MSNSCILAAFLALLLTSPNFNVVFWSFLAKQNVLLKRKIQCKKVLSSREEEAHQKIEKRESSILSFPVDRGYLGLIYNFSIPCNRALHC
jgi:hypothetical protein